MLFDGAVPEPLEQNCDLYGPGGDNKVEADCAPTVRLEENHQEAEADENHDVHVLKQVVLVVSFVEPLVQSPRVDSVPERSAPSEQNQHHELSEKHK